MSHYSDIGFEVFKAQDTLNIFNLIHSNEEINRQEWPIPHTDGIYYVLYKFGEIRYNAKLNYNTHQISAIGLGHNNEKISEAKYIKTIKGDSRALNFDNIMIEKDGIPFWFSCPNIEIVNVEKYQDIKLRIASFANNIEIKDLPKDSKSFDNPEELREYILSHDIEMAEESYIANFEGDQSYAFVSGIITDFKLEKNIFTEKDYYSIDFDCLGLHFKALVDTKLINEKDLQIGKVICGEFWNTALIENINLHFGENMQDKANELNNLYTPILKEIENIRQFLGSKCIDHALGFYNRNSIKINDKITSEIYPIPVITCKLNNINIDIALDLVSNEKYIGFIRFTFSKEDLLGFNFNLLRDFRFELYSYSYINTNFDFENVEQELIEIQESQETQFKIKISISNTNQIKDIINRLFNNRPKTFSITSFTCDCKRDISIESYDGCCPICGKESPGKRKFPKTCSVCEESFLVDQYGQGECPNCGWHNDRLSEERPDEVVYPNLLSKNKARKLYKEGKPFKPDLNDFLEALYFYSEVEFWYNGLNCWVCLTGGADTKIEFGWSPENIYYFSNKEDFIKNAKIGDEYVKDIWDLVEDPSYM